MSQDCSSLNSSTIGPRGTGDNDSHASLIPAPRSCTVSIASSFDNFNVNGNENVATSSIAEVTVSENAGESNMDLYEDNALHVNVSQMDNLSVLESVGSHDE